MFGTYRAFLALMVVALHLGGIPKIGAYAVFGFYCLSGYLMTLIMQTNYGLLLQELPNMPLIDFCVYIQSIGFLYYYHQH